MSLTSVERSDIRARITAVMAQVAADTGKSELHEVPWVGNDDVGGHPQKHLSWSQRADWLPQQQVTGIAGEGNPSGRSTQGHFQCTIVYYVRADISTTSTNVANRTEVDVLEQAVRRGIYSTIPYPNGAREVVVQDIPDTELEPIGDGGRDRMWRQEIPFIVECYRFNG